jgi:predicted nuclease with TOPRIM domain
MDPTAAAIGSSLNDKQVQLTNMGQQLDNTKNTLEQQTRDAKRLIQEAYSKQTYLRDMQNQITQQSLAIEQQKSALGQREANLLKLQGQLEKKLSEANLKADVLNSQTTMNVAIQTQMQQLDAK